MVLASERASYIRIIHHLLCEILFTLIKNIIQINKGGNLGTVATFQLSGILTPIIGWRMVFYGEAVLILIVTFLWMTLVANRPSEHHFISDKELKHIEHALGASVSKEKASQYSFVAET